MIYGYRAVWAYDSESAGRLIVGPIGDECSTFDHAAEIAAEAIANPRRADRVATVVLAPSGWFPRDIQLGNLAPA